MHGPEQDPKSKTIEISYSKSPKLEIPKVFLLNECSDFNSDFNGSLPDKIALFSKEDLGTFVFTSAGDFDRLVKVEVTINGTAIPYKISEDGKTFSITINETGLVKAKVTKISKDGKQLSAVSVQKVIAFTSLDLEAFKLDFDKSINKSKNACDNNLVLYFIFYLSSKNIISEEGRIEDDLKAVNSAICKNDTVFLDFYYIVKSLKLENFFTKDKNEITFTNGVLKNFIFHFDYYNTWDNQKFINLQRFFIKILNKYFETLNADKGLGKAFNVLDTFIENLVERLENPELLKKTKINGFDKFIAFFREEGLKLNEVKFPNILTIENAMKYNQTIKYNPIFPSYIEGILDISREFTTEDSFNAYVENEEGFKNLGQYIYELKRNDPMVIKYFNCVAKSSKLLFKETRLDKFMNMALVRMLCESIDIESDIENTALVDIIKEDIIPIFIRHNIITKAEDLNFVVFLEFALRFLPLTEIQNVGKKF